MNQEDLKRYYSELSLSPEARNRLSAPKPRTHWKPVLSCSIAALFILLVGGRFLKQMPDPTVPAPRPAPVEKIPEEEVPKKTVQKQDEASKAPVFTEPITDPAPEAVADEPPLILPKESTKLPTEDPIESLPEAPPKALPEEPPNVPPESVPNFTGILSGNEIMITNEATGETLAVPMAESIEAVYEVFGYCLTVTIHDDGTVTVLP